MQEYMNKYNGWVPCASGIMPEHVMDYNYKTEHPIINVLVSLKSGNVTKVQRTIYDHSWYFLPGYILLMCWRGDHCQRNIKVIYDE